MKLKRNKPLKKRTLAKLTQDNEPIISDVLGSYTGRPRDKGDKPTQDADDL